MENEENSGRASSFTQTLDDTPKMIETVAQENQRTAEEKEAKVKLLKNKKQTGKKEDNQPQNTFLKIKGSKPAKYKENDGKNQDASTETVLEWREEEQKLAEEIKTKTHEKSTKIISKLDEDFPHEILHKMYEDAYSHIQMEFQAEHQQETEYLHSTYGHYQ
ncbi:hypothetical protein JTB14_025381 [Gonioctena quinquepunctata]|nr:hypothetical protein JTB14_025381 [Gonioctena quinquepunctata]